MLKQLMTIIGLLTEIVVFIRSLEESQLLERLPQLLERLLQGEISTTPTCLGQSPQQTAIVPKDHYGEDELMTIKEAMAYIPASRSKLYEMRAEGILHTLERNCRHKRLIRAEVEAARQWSRNKGKW